MRKMVSSSLLFFFNVSNTNNSPILEHHHSNGIVVLISFCLSLGCVFVIVVAGVILNKIQRRRQGYVRAPQMQAVDRRSTLTRLPPEDLLNSLQRAHDHPDGAPTL